jgi:hypothetical protein
VFKTLIIDIGAELNLGKPEQANTYFIAFGGLTTNQASSITMELANKAFNHIMTATDLAITIKISINA